MPTAWASILIVLAVALAIAGASVWVVAAVGVLALVVDVVLSLIAVE